MKKFLLLFSCSIFFGAFSQAQRSVPLFNGKDLTGWKINGTEKWYVDNGELISESGPDKEYAFNNGEKL